MAVASDGSVFVTLRNTRGVARIERGATQVGTLGAVGAEPIGLSLSVDEKELYVANSQSGSLTVLDPKTLSARGEIPVGGQPWAVAALPDGKRAYVTDFSGGSVSVVDLTRRSVTGRVSLSQPQMVPQVGASFTDDALHTVLASGAADLTEVKTPSLKGVFSTGPYLHDGSAATLREVFMGTSPTVAEHDLRATLSDADADAIEAYLKTL